MAMIKMGKGATENHILEEMIIIYTTNARFVLYGHLGCRKFIYKCPDRKGRQDVLRIKEIEMHFR